MTTQHRYLVGVILAVLVAIVVLQGYLITSEFQNDTERFGKEVNLLLREIVEEDVEGRREILVTLFENLLNDTTRIVTTVAVDEDGNTNLYSVMDVGGDSPYTTASFSRDTLSAEAPDSIRVAHGRKLIVNAFRNDLERDRVYYYTEFMGEETNKWKDSLKTDSLALHTLLVNKMAEKGIETPFEMKLYDRKSDFVKNEDAIATEAYPTAVSSQVPFVSLVFESPFYEILKRTRLTILSAFLIIVFTAVCFIVMMRIIIRQRKLAAMKDDFVANVTHELQTPVSTVMAALESMESYGVLDDREKTKRYLAASRQEVSRLSDMVSNILEATTEDQDTDTSDFEKVDLVQLIEEVVAAARMRAGEEATISFEAKDQELVLHAHPGQLRDLLNNLLDNAIKYTADNPLLIGVSCERVGHQVKITVADNGPGIENQYQRHVFEKFYRIPTADIHDVKGHGIGLHYVKRIIDKHRGMIRIRPYTGQGTTFDITLPLATHGAGE